MENPSEKCKNCSIHVTTFFFVLAKMSILTKQYERGRNVKTAENKNGCALKFYAKIVPLTSSSLCQLSAVEIRYNKQNEDVMLMSKYV